MEISYEKKLTHKYSTSMLWPPKQKFEVNLLKKYKIFL